MFRLARSARTAVQRRSASNLMDSAESFLSGSSSVVLENMYEQWQKDPSSVHPSWKRYFESFHATPLVRPAPKGHVSGSSSTSTSQISEAALRDSIKMMQLIRAYRICGHLAADLDPLGLTLPQRHPELDPHSYGFSSTADDHKIFIGTELGGSSLNEQYAYQNFGDLVRKLKTTYTGRIGVEYFHITDVQQREWISHQMEHGKPHDISKEEKRNIYSYLAQAEGFENFLAQKFNTAKRFGLEGGESTIPCLEVSLETAAQLGVEAAVIGMAHRGRLNVLGNVMKKPFAQIFHEFKGEGNKGESTFFGSGDVKYHLGTSADRLIGGNSFHVSMTANPSHLEFVNPVVEGKTRAKQHFSGDTNRSRNMSILIHGDASFAGQGVVVETLSMSDLTHYSTGGTIHVIINNQIGFTTDPKSARSSPHPSDSAKTVGAPIFHVNGDDPEAVAFVSRVAVAWRQRFQKDVVIDIVCYRRHGHNEVDQPMFTQPVMYKRIKDLPSTLNLYTQRLIASGVFSEAELSSIRSEYAARLEADWAASKSYKPKASDWLEKNWQGFKTMAQLEGSRAPTGVPLEVLRAVGIKVSTLPEGFAAHAGVARVYNNRLAAMQSGKNIDWALGETLAYATLVREGYPVRLSGQDCERGTFSHRHSVIHDQNNGAQYIPLRHISSDQAFFRVTNSHLSEAAVLGFELGYSLEHPKLLVLWEAQFGDFANGAQVIIDQFITSGEAKWYRQSGLTMLLPHGYDGQGPEHSSARLERFLQMSDEDPYIFQSDPWKQEQAINYSVANITTPANFFHLLRRQVVRDFRKPLVVMTPKKLLRLKECASNIEDFAPNQAFRRVIPNTVSDATKVQDDKIRRVILCSGQVYYDLAEARSKRELESTIAIVRVEQIAPFPFLEVRDHAIAKYPNAEVMWLQEEPANMGSWSFVEPRLRTILREMGGVELTVRREPKYVGRKVAASPATGFSKVHEEEQAAIINAALTI
ncbi:mitochondrial 2-oxoglutarate dehydrogenase E1 form 1 [Andalucia godoyi]|uniref:2-oxoglutarate dehydrogenase, mitochondrial n=1 Tax=Andalucia godoyi TaxID=505711 RepID=A0A8K0AJ18_ANDGO|nr:mitochondrial 2-oxoglutarate dehydrogenase E1 form 1 [Andalucia godoyi]|eukprot:ANDGO_07540.mRNA.1 mitochondrial 2-oxoglutarate dehydrogenase E1 form 1